MSVQNTVDYPEIVKRLDQFGLLADEAVLKEALIEFDQGLAEQLDSIQHGVAAGDRRVIERSAHRIAGSCLTLGAARLGACASELERSAPNDSLDTLTAKITTMAAETASVRDYVARLLATPPHAATIRRGR